MVIFTARGGESFTPAERQALMGVASVRFVQAPRRLSVGALVRALEGAEIAGLTPRATPHLSAAALRRLKDLRAVAVPTTGYDWLPVNLFNARGVKVAYVPGFSSPSAAEMTWALILALCRRLVPAVARLKKGGAAADLCGLELCGRTLGVVGLGEIGARVARVGLAMGMRVVGSDPRARAPTGVEKMGLVRLLALSDVVTLHVPLKADTRHMISQGALARMRPGAFLVNTARPQIVEARALLRRLASGRLAGYAFDVSYESRGAILPLLQSPRVLAVPHISWYTRAAVRRETAAWVDTLVRLARGRSCAWAR